MTDLIIIFIVAAVMVLAAGYVYKSKKGGRKCIGCPYGGSCESGSCSCSCGENIEES